MNITKLALYPQSLPEMSQNLPFPSYQCSYPENLNTGKGVEYFTNNWRVKSPLIYMCRILRLCLYCYVRKVSNTISVTQIVIINTLLIVISIYQNSGLGWRCALIGYSSSKIFCYPPPSNSYGFVLKNIAIVEGINELKSSFEHYYLTVVVYTQFKHISFQNIYSPQCQWLYQWPYHAAVQLGKYPPLNSSTSVNNC